MFMATPSANKDWEKPPDAPQEQVVAASAADSHIDTTSAREFFRRPATAGRLGKPPAADFK
jgi:hypothetical protein